MLRPFNMAHAKVQAVIPTIISQIASGQKKFSLALCLQLVILTLWLMCTFLELGGCDAALGHVVNAASNFEISIGETASLISNVMNAEVEITPMSKG